MNITTPCTKEEIRDYLQETKRLRICGNCSQLSWLPPFGGEYLCLSAFNQIVDYRPNDLAVCVQGGILLSELQEELQKDKLSLCLPGGININQQNTVSGWVALGLPQLGESQIGSVKDSVLGMKVMRSNGEIVTFGSQVAKSVAGYDLQRTMVGSRGGLGIIIEVTLRLRSIKNIPSFEAEKFAQESIYVSYPDNPNQEIMISSEKPEFKNVSTCFGPDGFVYPEPSQAVRQIQRNLKEVFDPQNKFVEGYAI